MDSGVAWFLDTRWGGAITMAARDRNYELKYHLLNYLYVCLNNLISVERRKYFFIQNINFAASCTLLTGAAAAPLQMGQDMCRFTDRPHYGIGYKEYPFYLVPVHCNHYRIASLHSPGYPVTSYRVPINCNVIRSRAEEKVRLG